MKYGIGEYDKEYRRFDLDKYGDIKNKILEFAKKDDTEHIFMLCIINSFMNSYLLWA